MEHMPRKIFGLRGTPQGSSEQFDTLTDEQVLGRFFMHDPALREALQDIAEILLQTEKVREDADRLDILCGHVQERINELTKSARGDAMQSEAIRTYVQRKMVERE